VIRFRSQASLCGICVGQIGTGVGPSPNNSGSPVIIPPTLHNYASFTKFRRYIILIDIAIKYNTFLLTHYSSPILHSFDIQGLTLTPNIPFGATGNCDILWLRIIALREWICSLKVPEL